MIEVITQNERHIFLIFQFELCDPIPVGDYVRAYCHIHGSDHQRSLSINKLTGWGHCFNAACEATVLVAEWNFVATKRLISWYYQGIPAWSRSAAQTPVRTSSPITQPVLLLPAKAPPLWQQEERLALLSLDEQMREALMQSKRAQAYLHEREIPLRVAQAAGVGYLPAALLRLPKVQEQRNLLHRWVERLLFPLQSPDGKGYIGRSLWRWVPGMDENAHKALLDRPRTARRWIKTNPAGWFGYDPDQLSENIMLVEGTFDRLALLSAGVRPGEVVALAGTAIRADWFPPHVSAVILALDADAGGEQAAERLIDRLGKSGIRADSCPPPQDHWGKDWSERWRTMGPVSIVPLLEVRSSLQSVVQTQKQGA